MTPLVVDALQTELEAVTVDAFAFLMAAFVAAIFIAVGVFAGRKLQPIVRRFGQRIELDARVRETPFGELFADESTAVSNAAGTLAKYYVVLLAAFAAATYLGLSSVSDWIEFIVGFAPTVVAGFAILVVGFVIADPIATIVREAEAVQESRVAPLAGGATKALVCFVAAVIGLDTMGLNVAILYTFGQAFAFAAALGIALAIGIAFGWGGKEYVAANADDWFGQSPESRADPAAVSDDD